MNTTALELIQSTFPDLPCTASLDAVVLTVQPEQLETTLSRLKNDPELQFGLLVDVTAVDYLTYPVAQEADGIPNWKDAPPIVPAVKDQVRAEG